MILELFVIALINDDGSAPRYLYRDSECGDLIGSDRLQSALMMTEKEAEEKFQELLNTTPHARYSDGIEYPPDYIHRGLRMSHAVPKASGRLEIQRIAPKAIKSIPVSGEIRRPKSVHYTY